VEVLEVVKEDLVELEILQAHLDLVMLEDTLHLKEIQVGMEQLQMYGIVTVALKDQFNMEAEEEGLEP
jgi:hypothetical protein